MTQPPHGWTLMSGGPTKGEGMDHWGVDKNLHNGTLDDCTHELCTERRLKAVLMLHRWKMYTGASTNPAIKAGAV